MLRDMTFIEDIVQGIKSGIDLILKEEEDKGLQEVKIPKTLNGQTHNKVSAFYKFKYGWLLVGYAIRKAGFSLDEQMGESGSPLIRNMIKEQLDGAGINLTSDEHVVVEINQPDDEMLLAILTKLLVDKQFIIKSPINIRNFLIMDLKIFLNPIYNLLKKFP